jgi:nitrogen fixation protein NifX
MLRIAFASSDRTTVNLHFGGAESLMIYDVAPGQADLVSVAEFMKAEPIGETGRVGLTGSVEDKVLPKLDFVEGCSAVYAASIGSSSIRRLMKLGIQPIIVDTGHEIMDLLNEVSLALVYGGLAWVDRAKAKALAAPRTETIAAGAPKHVLLSSVDDME